MRGILFLSLFAAALSQAPVITPVATTPVALSQALGCTDATASNYDPTANTDDGSCVAVVGLDDISSIPDLTEDGSHEDVSHEDGSHEDGSHEDGSHEDVSHEDGSHEDVSHEDGSHEDDDDRTWLSATFYILIMVVFVVFGGLTNSLLSKLRIFLLCSGFATVFFIITAYETDNFQSESWLMLLNGAVVSLTFLMFAYVTFNFDTHQILTPVSYVVLSVILIMFTYVSSNERERIWLSLSMASIVVVVFAVFIYLLGGVIYCCCIKKNTEDKDKKTALMSDIENVVTGTTVNPLKNRNTLKF